jgi:hypothetical protein
LFRDTRVLGSSAPNSRSRAANLLDERDRVGDPACLPVGAGQVVPRPYGVRIVGAQQTVEVRDQRLADRDGVRHGVTQLDQVIEPEGSKPRQHRG